DIRTAQTCAMNCSLRAGLSMVKTRPTRGDALAAQSSVSFAIRGPIARHDFPGLCARIRQLLANCSARVAWCDVRAVDADLVTVDALARLQLAAHRHGCQVRLRGA